MKITGKRGKATYGLRITISAHCNEQLTRSDIDPGSIGMQDRQLITPSMTLLRLIRMVGATGFEPVTPTV